MQCLITGGAGFIGSHLAELLISEGHKVRILDNLRSGNWANVEHLAVTRIEGDVRHSTIVEEAAEKCNAIFHLAALVSVPESLKQAEECIGINAIGTLNVLKAARGISGCCVVLSSSAANYGNNPSLPKRESMLPEPLSPYAVTKLDGEYYLNIFHHEWSLSATSLRYFNVFGPRQNPASQYAAAVPIFICWALRNQPLVLYGDGQQTRDFIYVNDVARANLFATAQGGELFNVACGTSITILELARRIIDLTGSRSEIKFAAERPGDIKHSQADITKILQAGFQPHYTLEAGLAETIAYYEAELREEIHDGS